MKKLLFYISIISLFASACERELTEPFDEKQQEESSVELIPFEFIGRIVNDQESKTSYDEDLKFSWVKGDVGRLIVYNNGNDQLNQETITAQNAGSVTTFSGSIPEGYSSTGYAYYPYAYSGQYAGTKDAPALKAFKPYLNLSQTPLIGKRVSEGVYDFSTACGIIKLTITSIPAEVTQIKMVSDLVKTPVFNFTGTYTIQEDNGNCFIGTSQVADGVANVTYSIGAHAEGSDLIVYFPVAVGTIARGLSIRFLNSSDEEVSRLPETTTALNIERNTIYNFPSMAVPRWSNIGKGEMIDNATSAYNIKSSGYAAVDIEQCTTDSYRYRIINPYRVLKEKAGRSETSLIIGPDKYLYFRISESDNKVYFEPYYTGIINSQEIVLKHGKHGNWDGDYKSDANSVVSSGTAGAPVSIKLAPNFWYATANNGWTRANDGASAERIIINMPSLSVAVEPHGDATDNHFDFTWGSTTSTVAYVKAWLSTSSSGDEPISAVKVTGTTSNVAIAAPTYSGKYYLIYNLYDEGNNLLSQRFIVFNYILPSTAAAVTALKPAWSQGKSWAYSVYMKNSALWASAEYNMFEVSDDPTKGNLKLVNFVGMSYDISQQHLWDSLSGYSNGSPIYGTLDYSSLSLTFIFNKEKPFYYDSGSNPHFLGAVTPTGDNINIDSGNSSHFSNGFKFTINGEIESTTYPLVSYYTHMGDIKYNTSLTPDSKACVFMGVHLGSSGDTITE